MIRFALASLFILGSTPAFAKSWCAQPLLVHEWGVQVFNGNGELLAGGGVPAWFHRAQEGVVARTPVRLMPPDGGERDLPVLHFYSPSRREVIPLGLEVGFKLGSASAWFPRADHVIDAATANGAEALRARKALLEQRAGTQRPTPADPTRQLGWDFLELRTTPKYDTNQTDVAWIKDARMIDSLWVNGPTESERFLFYEAKTSEKTPLALVRGNTFGPGRRHYELHNRGKHTVHDVLVIQRDKDAVYIFHAPAIPAGKSAGFLIEDHRVKDLRAETRGVLEASMVDPAHPAPPKEPTYDYGDGKCVMMRDPAIPVEAAAGHNLYKSELDILLDTWGQTFFGQPGTTIVYREDEAYLDEVMPLSVYTDMANYVVLQRAGLAVWQGVVLP